jgi:hypothetical protein
VSEQIDLQGCEHCGKEFNICSMRMMEDAWFCETCTSEFQEAFAVCEHQWSPHTDQMGDAGQVCEKCLGFVRDEDFGRMFKSAAPSRS